MTRYTLEQSLRAVGSPEEFLRTIGPGTDTSHLRLFVDVREEFTNWRDEQAAWKESCALADLSHHMYDLHLEGPGAVSLLEDVAVNDFSNFEPGKAKQFVAVSPDGYLIGDGILFYVAKNEFVLVGYSPINWVRYNLETGDYDATARVNPHGGVREGPPETFRYQVQGPDALAVMREAIDGDLPNPPFFNFEEIAIAGERAYALRHGMMNEPGFEVFGPWKSADPVKNAILAAGDEYDMRRIGAKSYPTNVIPTAWVAVPVPAIYSDGMEEYREWLNAGTWEGALTVGGSFDPGDVSEYYLDPAELGYDRFIDWDRDFIGKQALQERVENGQRTKVTLVWDHEDVSDIFSSHFGREQTYKWTELPTPNWATTMYDEVRKDGEPIGVAIAPRYLYFEKTMFSLGVVDESVAEPGTRVTLIWGEDGESSNPRVEAHEQKEITATIEPAPYYEDKRKTTEYTAAK